MSGIGHLAAGFAAKPAVPKIPLWVFLVSSETNDILYFLFVAIGLEQKAVTTMNFNEGIKYLAPSSNPWSHGLFMSVAWSLAAAVLGFLVYKDRRIGLLLGGVVFSHWLLDFLMHSNLPLFMDGSPLIGLGLENSGPGMVFMTIFDLVILAVGIIVYFRARKNEHSRKAKRDDR